MKYVITQSQFHKLVYGYLNKLVKSAEVDIQNSKYVEGGFSVTVDTDGQRKFTYQFTPEGESWDDPTDKIYPENGSLIIKNGIVDDMKDLFGLRKSKLFDLIAKAKIDKYIIIKISSFFLFIIIKKIKINKN